MSEHHNNPTRLNEIEAALEQLQPAAAALDRDRIFFAAGQAAAQAAPSGHARRNSWSWPAAVAAMAIVSLTLAGLWRHERRQRIASDNRDAAAPAESLAVPETEVAAIEPPAESLLDLDFVPPASDYLVLRDRVLREGAEALPNPAPADASSHAPWQAGPGAWRSAAGNGI